MRGTTEAINLVAQSFGRPRLRPGDEILITWLEHHANIVPWQLLCEQTGATLKVAPITPHRRGRFRGVRAPAIGQRTRLVALAHVSNALGTIVPVERFIARPRSAACPVLLDGAQAVPHLRVDVQALDCDFYCFSGHKMYGPTGIGVLYGREALLEAMPPWQGGGDMILTVTFEKTIYNDLPYKFEAGTPDIAGAIGLGAAIDYLERARHGAHRGRTSTSCCEYATRAARRQFPGCASSARRREKAAVISFTLDGIHPHDLGTILDHEGVAIRTGHHCAMPVMDFFKVPATARASFAFYNTRERGRPAGRRAGHGTRGVRLMDLKDLYRDVILDHNRHPRNFGEMLDPADARADGLNPLCGDRLTCT